VKDLKNIGVRLGNWLLPDQAVALLDAPDPETMKGKRDVALLAILVACGLRRREAISVFSNGFLTHVSGPTIRIRLTINRKSLCGTPV
jgi:site-specific recombinase XerD